MSLIIGTIIDLNQQSFHLVAVPRLTEGGHFYSCSRWIAYRGCLYKPSTEILSSPQTPFLPVSSPTLLAAERRRPKSECTAHQLLSNHMSFLGVLTDSSCVYIIFSGIECIKQKKFPKSWKIFHSSLDCNIHQNWRQELFQRILELFSWHLAWDAL